MPATFPVTSYPTGWFHIVYGDELQPGEVLPVSYFGRDLVCYRTESGRACLTEAYCPHLGAHLGYGGAVRGESLVCPFHLWEFDPSGANTCIPYAPTTNRGASLRTYPVAEAHGIVFAWFAADRAAAGWTPADIAIPELADPAYAPIDRTAIEVSVHPQEIFENVVDGAHFVAIHKARQFPDMSIETDGPWLRSVATSELTSRSGSFQGIVDSQLWGLGIDVNRITGAVDTFTLLTLTPVDEQRLRARLTVGARDQQGRAKLLRAARDMVVREFEHDCVIWDHKRYEPSPALAATEKGIGTFRRWAQQFYPAAAGDR